MLTMGIEALTKILEIGSPVHYKTIAGKMRIDSNYAKLICNFLGKGKYIDISIKGVCKMTSKGKLELERKNRV